MGMYDNLKCGYPLPDKEVQDKNFQTKDLECAMIEYEIVNGGWLFKLTDWGDGNIITLDSPRLVKHTGCVNFCTFLDHQDIHGTWYEYQAYFVKGKLNNMEAIDTPNKED